MVKGDGQGNFVAKSILESGIFIPGNGKALVKLRGKDGKYLAAAAQNRGTLKVLELKQSMNSVSLKPGDIRAEIIFSDGRKRKAEVNYGSSFLSQSARFISIGKDVKSVSITESTGKIKKIVF